MEDPRSRLGAPFPTTHLSFVELLAQPQAPAFREAWDRFFRAYWPPLYAFLRRAGAPREQALDVLQDFFVDGLEGDLLSRYDPARGRLRTFLLTCLRNLNWKANRRERARRDRTPLDLFSTDALEDRLADSTSPDPARVFEEEWALVILHRAVREMEERLGVDERSLRVLREWVLAEKRPKAAHLAAALEITTGDLYTRGTRMRQALMAQVEAAVREYCPGTAEAVQERDEVLRLLASRWAGRGESG